ncbi:MAG: LysR family transcriptional regulator [Pontibacterium sp.]
MNIIKLAPLLLIYAEVAKQRSFTKAAKKLSLSKSAVSQQIKRLESELNMQLLARNTRGVVLTQIGETLLSRCELLSEQLANAVGDIQQVKAQPSGPFKISVPPFFERSIVVPALRQLCLEYPCITPELVITGKWQDLIEHQLDAAIFGGTLRDSNYKAQSIGKVRDVFCATANYLQYSGTPTSLEELNNQKYIASAWHQGTLKLVDKRDDAEHNIDITPTLSTNSLSTLVEMTQADMGLALIPEFISQPKIRKGHLVQVLPEYHGRPWHFYFLHRYQGNKPIYVERFYRLVCHYFRAHTLEKT